MMHDHLPDPDKRNLYRFPWSMNDNPQGWVEVTDICNLQCRGCYRQRLEGHKSLAHIKEEILFLKRWRNCDNISLAGGEPVLHPEIVEIVRFVAEQGMKPFMLGNGVALNRQILTELRRAGLVGVGLHVDIGQNRPGWERATEVELCELRGNLADLVQGVGAVSCNFNSTIYKENFDAIPHLVSWAVTNSARVQGYTFMTYRAAIVKPGRTYQVHGREVALTDETLGYATSQAADEDIDTSSIDVYRAIKAHLPEYTPSVYLGGTKDHASFKWLDGVVLCAGGRALGSMGRKGMEFTQAMHHLVFGTYLIYLKRKSPGKSVLLLGLIDQEIRRAAFRLLRNPLRLFMPLRTVGIGIVQAPDVLNHGDVDMCESCPDITYFNGRLVNSCRLDEYRKFGAALSPGHAAPATAAPIRETAPPVAN